MTIISMCTAAAIYPAEHMASCISVQCVYMAPYVYLLWQVYVTPCLLQKDKKKKKIT